MPRLRLGVDVGGTFTDHILFEEESGELFTFKTPSTPDDPSRSVLDGVHHFTRDRSQGLKGLGLVAHGTTVNTNAILSRTGAKAGLITTENNGIDLWVEFTDAGREYAASIGIRV